MNDNIRSAASPLLWNNRIDNGMDAGCAAVLANVEKKARCRFFLSDHRLAAGRYPGHLRGSVC